MPGYLDAESVAEAADSVTGAANAAVSITLPPVPGQSWMLPAVAFSYAGGTAAGGLKIWIRNAANSADESLVYDVALTQTTEAVVPFPAPLKFPAGRAVRVELAAGGSAVVGKLNVTGKFTRVG